MSDSQNDSNDTTLDWACATCTYMNESQLRYCEMCTAPVPSTEAKKRKKDKRRIQQKCDLTRSDLDSDCNQSITESGKVSKRKIKKRKTQDVKLASTALRKNQERSEVQPIEKQNVKDFSVYGVSISSLKQCMKQKNDQKLLELLETLTHTLALTEASQDGDWRDAMIHMSSLFFNTEDTLYGSPKCRSSPALLNLLIRVFKRYTRKRHQKSSVNLAEDDRLICALRLSSIQSLIYLIKLEKASIEHLKFLEITKLLMQILTEWKDSNFGSACIKETSLAEECLAGIGWLSKIEPGVIKMLVTENMIQTEDAKSLLQALTDLVKSILEMDCFHVNVLMAPMDLLRKCLFRMHWSTIASSDSGNAHATPLMTMPLAHAIMQVLYGYLQSTKFQLHMHAAKCMLCLFHRLPVDQDVGILIDSKMIQLCLTRVSASDVDVESRLSMLSILYYLLERRSEFVASFVGSSMYKPFFQALIHYSVQNAFESATRISTSGSMWTIRAQTNQLERLTSQISAAMLRVSDVLVRYACGKDRNASASYQLLRDLIRLDSIIGVQALLSEGIELSQSQTSDHETPLLCAVRHASLSMIALILRRGADVNACGDTGTALHLAVMLNRCDVVALLLEYGADLGKTDHNGQTVMDLANGDRQDGAEHGVAAPMTLFLKFLKSNSGNYASRKKQFWTMNEIDTMDQYDSDEEYGQESLSSDLDNASMADDVAHDGIVHIEEIEGEEDIDRDFDDDSEDEAKNTSTTSSQDHPLLPNKLMFRLQKAMLKALLSFIPESDIAHLNQSVLFNLTRLLECTTSRSLRILGKHKMQLLDVIYILLQGSLSELCPSRVSLKWPRIQNASQQSIMTYRRLLCAIRILQAILSREDSLVEFFELQRRGIPKLIKKCRYLWLSTQTKHTEDPPQIYIRLRSRIKALKSQRQTSDGLQRNLQHLSTRLQGKDLERDEIFAGKLLKELYQLLNRPNSITSYEFQRYDLLHGMLYYFQGRDHPNKLLFTLEPLPNRIQSFTKIFESSFTAFERLVTFLQRIVNQEEQFSTVKPLQMERYLGDRNENLQALSRQLTVTITPKFPKRICKENFGKMSLGPNVKKFAVKPLAQFQALERLVLRSLPIFDVKLQWLYTNLTGHCVWKLMKGGKWVLLDILGYDPTRSLHLVRCLKREGQGDMTLGLLERKRKRDYSVLRMEGNSDGVKCGGTEEQFTNKVMEIALHDGPWKLTRKVTVIEGRTIKIKYFGKQVCESQVLASVSSWLSTKESEDRAGHLISQSAVPDADTFKGSLRNDVKNHTTENQQLLSHQHISGLGSVGDNVWVLPKTDPASKTSKGFKDPNSKRKASSIALSGAIIALQSSHESAKGNSTELSSVSAYVRVTSLSVTAESVTKMQSKVIKVRGLQLMSLALLAKEQDIARSIIGKHFAEADSDRNDKYWLSHPSPPNSNTVWTCFSAPQVHLTLRLQKWQSQDTLLEGTGGTYRDSRMQKHKERKCSGTMSKLIRKTSTSTDSEEFEWLPHVKNAFLKIFYSIALAKKDVKSISNTEKSASSLKKKGKGRKTIKLDLKEVMEIDLDALRHKKKCHWDIVVLSDFLIEYLGCSFKTKWLHKLWISFSAHANPEQNRRYLFADDFLNVMCEICLGSEHIATSLLQLLRPERLAKHAANAMSNGLDTGKVYKDDIKRRKECNPPLKKKFYSFRGDQCMLQCLNWLRAASEMDISLNEENVTDSSDSTAGLDSFDNEHQLQCRFKIHWPSRKQRRSNMEDSGPLHAESDESIKQFRLRRSLKLQDPQAEGDALIAMQVLKYLHDGWKQSLTLQAETKAQSPNLWINKMLYGKVQDQLEHILLVCTNTYPEWCNLLLLRYGFLLPCELREAWFRATSFGSVRSLAYFRDNYLHPNDVSDSQQPTQLIYDTTEAMASLNIPIAHYLDETGGLDVDLAGLTTETSISDSAAPEQVQKQVFKSLFSIKENEKVTDDELTHEFTLPPLLKERVRVSRNDLLTSATMALRAHSKRKAVMEVVFADEKGYGSGVTAEFYSVLAYTFQSNHLSSEKGGNCWISGTESYESKETDSFDLIRQPFGLFPYPYAKVPPKICGMFDTMGRLTGKALMDRRLLPLPFSTFFLDLVVYDKSIEVNELDKVFGHTGKVIRLLHEAFYNAETKGSIEGMSLQIWLDTACLSFVDPLSQVDLIARGSDVQITTSNLPEYISAVLNFWRSGVQPQVIAFREALSDILPIDKLRLLNSKELHDILCGDADVHWDAASLLSSMKFAHGFSQESLTIKYFIECLVDMSPSERRDFLLYATGCPNLPPGGISSLQPRMEVIERNVDVGSVDQALPFARTCTNTFHLPSYSSKAVLVERLHYAIRNSQGVIDRD